MSELDKSVDATFLSRWSRRKVAAKNEPQVASETDLSTEQVTVPVAPAGRHADRDTRANSSTDAPAGMKMPETPCPEPTSPAGDRAREELPSIETLTHESDFSPFMGKEVDPGLRNQAMKKLFKDPHYQFGQMDKLDIYIDDYSKPDPIPLEMLRQMNQAKSLFLFEDEEKDSPLTDPTIGGVTSAVPLTSGDIASPEEDAQSKDSVKRVDTNEGRIVDAEIDLQQDKVK